MRMNSLQYDSKIECLRGGVRPLEEDGFRAQLHSRVSHKGLGRNWLTSPISFTRVFQSKRSNNILQYCEAKYINEIK